MVSTPVSAPVIAATRLRRGATNSAKGAARQEQRWVSDAQVAEITFTAFTTAASRPPARAT